MNDNLGAELPTVLVPDLDKAYKTYQKHILEVDQDLVPILETYNFKNAMPDWKWEILAAILVGDKSRKGTLEKEFVKNPNNKKGQKGKKGNSKNGNGPDLMFHEVKARLDGAAFEYQYHRDSWREKLVEEPKVGHIFISYWAGYQDLDIRRVEGSELAGLFGSWKNLIEDKYANTNFNDRCRLYVPYKMAIEKGTLLLRIRDTKIVSFAPHLKNLSASTY